MTADLTAACAAAKDAGEADDARWRDACQASPGLGWPPVLPPSPIAAGELRGVGADYRPDSVSVPVAVGEGYAVPPDPQPRQVVADHGILVHGRVPGYAQADAAGVNFGAVQAPGPDVLFISPDLAAEAVAPHASLVGKLLGKLRRR